MKTTEKILGEIKKAPIKGLSVSNNLECNEPYIHKIKIISQEIAEQKAEQILRGDV